MDLKAKEPTVLVTVASVEGSGPREPGAHMLVTLAGCQGTVGGGHLEQRAIEIARTMLGKGRQRHIERFALGPTLGQCCGGVVHLAFEIADADHLSLLHERRLQDTWRVTSLDLKARALVDEQGRHLVGHATPVIDRTRGTHLMRTPDGTRWLVDPIRATRARLLLFGAGHVGAALVRALADLPCQVTWIDEREDQFPDTVPANTTVEASDTPEALVAQAPAGASYLVMTHSHALDQRLTEAILARPDVGWFGLIGSRTKRKQFEHRLRERGADPARVAAMICPIGLPGIRSKAPAIIAASVCAQLLMVWETQSALHQGF